MPEYTKLLMNDTYNAYWKEDPRTEAMTQLQIPLLLLDGWYDFYLEGMFSMWERMPDETRKKSAFIIGPWGHDVKTSGQADYHFENGNIPDDYAVKWFDSIRAKTEYAYAQRGKIQYYSLGDACWYQGSSPAETKQRLYFGADRNLMEDSGSSEDGNAISYYYDPSVLVGEKDPFRYCDLHKAEEPDSREGLISFFSEETEEDRRYYGRIRWHMFVQSDCEDTAFRMRVYFMENGETCNLTETITSLSHISPAYRPGERVLIDLETPPIAFTLKKGSRIRIDITSECGVYAPHANVRGHWAEVTEEKIARNTIFCEDAYVELPYMEPAKGI